MCTTQVGKAMIYHHNDIDAIVIVNINADKTALIFFSRSFKSKNGMQQ